MFLVVTFIHNTDETFERFTIIKTLVKCIRLKKILLQIQTNLHNFTYNICRKWHLRICKVTFFFLSENFGMDNASFTFGGG